MPEIKDEGEIVCAKQSKRRQSAGGQGSWWLSSQSAPAVLRHVYLLRRGSQLRGALLIGENRAFCARFFLGLWDSSPQTPEPAAL